MEVNLPHPGYYATRIELMTEVNNPLNTTISRVFQIEAGAVAWF
jgi:hypothetical protein